MRRGLRGYSQEKKNGLKVHRNPRTSDLFIGWGGIGQIAQGKLVDGREVKLGLGPF